MFYPPIHYQGGDELVYNTMLTACDRLRPPPTAGGGFKINLP